VDISAQCGKGGQCRSGQFGTMLQGWTLQEWTNQHDVARVDIAGAKWARRSQLNRPGPTAAALSLGDGAVTAAVTQQAGSDPASQ